MAPENGHDARAGAAQTREYAQSCCGIEYAIDHSPSHPRRDAMKKSATKTNGIAKHAPKDLTPRMGVVGQNLRA